MPYEWPENIHISEPLAGGDRTNHSRELHHSVLPYRMLRDREGRFAEWGTCPRKVSGNSQLEAIRMRKREVVVLSKSPNKHDIYLEIG